MGERLGLASNPPVDRQGPSPSDPNSFSDLFFFLSFFFITPSSLFLYLSPQNTPYRKTGIPEWYSAVSHTWALTDAAASSWKALHTIIKSLLVNISPGNLPGGLSPRSCPREGPPSCVWAAIWTLLCQHPCPAGLWLFAYTPVFSNHPRDSSRQELAYSS